MKKARFNPLGIQMIPELLHKKLFGGKQSPTLNANVGAILSELKKSIENVQVRREPISNSQSTRYPWDSITKFMPSLQKDVVEHLNYLGRKYSGPYVNCILQLIDIPDTLLEQRPPNWCFQPGWTRYTLSEENAYIAESVSYPLEDSIVFDVEVCMEENNYNRPTLAVALTPKAWYSWCSEALLNAKQQSSQVDGVNLVSRITLEDLIPMGRANETERLIVGHNVSFDRSYIQEQYNIDLDQTRFLDTMSLHICVSGLNQEQKLFAIRNGNPWDDVSSLNNLNDVYKLYCDSKTDVNKDPRDIFVKGTMLDVYDNFNYLTDYCANDVAVTLKILKSLFPLFVKRFPSPITLAGMFEMSVMYLPVNQKTWRRYLNECQLIYQEYKEEINQTLREIASETCSLLDGQHYIKDPWLWDLDWSTRALTYKKSFYTFEDKPKKTVKSKDIVEDLIATSKHLKKNQPILPGYPKWFVDFCDNSKYINQLHKISFNDIFDLNQVNISPKLRTIPKLLKLTWNGFPLYYDKSYGWGYLVPNFAENCDSKSEFVDAIENIVETEEAYRLVASQEGIANVVAGCLFFKLPHKDGPNRRVGNPLSKDFMQKIASGTLRSLVSTVNELVVQQNKISYWVNSSKRIVSQIVVAYDERAHGCILPRVVVAGTVTRRAVEPTWLTASNSYRDRLGSELKGIIHCPPQYCYVGADVDSQELWIASLFGDANYCGVQGATGLGWMTLQGDKASGTDMHSVTANTIHITRDEAKVLNYARIYGSGPDFAARFLKQSNPELTEEEAKMKAKKIFVQTKGLKRKLTHWNDDSAVARREWVGGTESYMFNKLESIASSKNPETPILKCRISRALEPEAVGHDYMTSRINWVVQSSAVDFLHILLVTMKWLMEHYKIDGRFSISIHDEIRYLIKTEDKYRAALALQLSNLLTRAYFTSVLDLNDLPASVAFFSSIEIDRCLRKDANDDCQTPSNPLGLSKGYGVEAGVSLNISQLLDILEGEDPLFCGSTTTSVSCDEPNQHWCRQ